MPLLHEDVTSKILECCFEVINELGAGFLETVYEKALCIALQQKGLNIGFQVPLSVSFRGQSVGDFFADLVVDERVIVEIKAVKALAPEHQAQLINYLKATGIRVGLLVNFGNPKLEFKRSYFDPPRPEGETRPQQDAQQE